jgi:3alpha(or 20beta)-hydroxysteroid dehydrogenase
VGATLDGKVALVTGAARGQGAAVARCFVQEGARVVVTDVADDDGRTLAAQLGTATAYHHLDVSSEREWSAATAHTIERFGRLDILVNNAGVLFRGSIADTSLDDYMRVVMINQVGCWLGMRAALPHLQAAGGGSIVNTSSIAGLAALAERSAYVASKFAVRAMSRVAAQEFAASGIRVNSIHPGAVDTDMLRSLGEAPLALDQPIPRVGRVEEVARLVLFLASDESSYCTGAEFVIDGGLSAGVRI